jgi:LppP/LprE lipoprotein
MAEHPPPRRRSGTSPKAPDHLTPERVLALAGVAGLLLVGVIVFILVAGAAGGDGNDTEVAAQPTATATPTPTATAKPKPTPVPLTAEQKAERQAAADIVASRGFEVVRLKDYDPRKTLRVLIGRSTSGSELAFFFVNGDYIGNDAQDPSAIMKVARKGDLTVTIAYRIYAPGDAQDKPTGGPVRVRFTWDGTRLVPQDPLPPPEQRTPGRQPA